MKGEAGFPAGRPVWDSLTKRTGLNQSQASAIFTRRHEPRLLECATCPISRQRQGETSIANPCLFLAFQLQKRRNSTPKPHLSALFVTWFGCFREEVHATDSCDERPRWSSVLSRAPTLLRASDAMRSWECCPPAAPHRARGPYPAHAIAQWR